MYGGANCWYGVILRKRGRKQSQYIIKKSSEVVGHVLRFLALIMICSIFG